jgi:hypothetical protein
MGCVSQPVLEKERPVLNMENNCSLELDLVRV